MPEDKQSDSALPQTREELQALISEAISQLVAKPGEPVADSPLAGELAKLQRQLETERKEREKLHTQLAEKERRAEEIERYSRIRTLIADAKATKVDVVFKNLKDDIYRGEDGELYAKVKGEDLPASEYVAGFLRENPEFLPPRIAGGSGSAPNRGASGAREVQLEDIKPGASPEVLEAARKKISELVGATLQ